MRQKVSTVRSSAIPLSRTMRTIQAKTSLWCCRNSASKASRSPDAKRSNSSICHSLSLLTDSWRLWLQFFTVPAFTSIGEFSRVAARKDCKRRRPRRLKCPGLLVSAKPRSVDVVLLPVEGGVGLDDDVFVRGLLEFVNEHGLAGLQGFGDLGIHADGEVRAFVIGSGHLARFGLDFVAEGGDGFHHAGAGAIRARLAEDALERLLGALASDADEAEFVEGQRLGRSLVLFQ